MAKKKKKQSNKLNNPQVNPRTSPQSLEQQQLKPQGGYVSVLNYTTQTIYSGLTPQRLAAILIELRQGWSRDFLILAEEFEEKDPHFISTMGVRKRALITTEPTLFSTGVNNKQAIALAEEFIQQPFFSNLVMDLLDAISKGFSVCEMLWYKNKVVGYKHIPAYWFGYNEFGVLQVYNKEGTELLPIVPSASPDYLQKKFIINEPRSKSGLQIRSGIILPAAVYLLFKAYAIKDFVAFAEVFGMPLRWGKYGPDASPEDINSLKKAVANLGVDAAAVTPANMDIVFQEVNKGDGAKLYGMLLDYLDKQISKLILGQTMTTDNGGSMAQAKVHNDIRLDIVKSDARQLEVVLNKFLRNYIDQTLGVQQFYPKIHWDIEEQEDKVALANILPNLRGTGLRISKSDMMNKFGFVEAKNDDDVLNLDNIPTAPSQIKPQQNSIELNAKKNKDGLDELQDALVSNKDAEKIENQLFAPVLKAVESATDYDDLQERLSKAVLNSTALQNKVQELDAAASIVGDQKDKI